jgi:hypothetical protein
MVGSDGKWSKALKAAFIEASLAGLVKMPVNQPGVAAVSGEVTPYRLRRVIPGLTSGGASVHQEVTTLLLRVIEEPVRSDTA